MTGGPALLQSQDDRSLLKWLDYVLIATVTFAVFTPVLHSCFSQLDDVLMLISNKQVIEPSWAGFAEIWQRPKYRIYMPLPLTIWQIISALTSHGKMTLDPLWFKVTSLLCHVLAAMAAAWTLSLLTRSRWPAIVGALLFALHPVQVESVAWTTGLKDVLCGLFVILAIGSYARFAFRNPVSHWRDGFWWATLAWSILAMLSKPTAMTLPAILLAVDYFCRQSLLGRRAASLFPLALPAVVCALIIAVVQAHSSSEQAPNLWRPLVVADTYSFYLRQLVWPVHLNIDYGRTPTAALASGALMWTWSIPVSMLLVVFFLRNKTIGLAAVIFVVPVLPVSGIITFDMQQYSTVADHYMYQPMLGAGLLIAYALHRSRPWANALAITGLLACAVLSWSYAKIWRSTESLFGYVYAENPKSWLARSALAGVAFGDGDYLTAVKLDNAALQLNPHSAPALMNLSDIALSRGNLRAAVDFALRAIPLQPMPEDSAKRILMIGASINDRDLAKRAVKLWLRSEPENETAQDILRAINASEAAEAATRPARPSTTPTP